MRRSPGTTRLSIRPVTVSIPSFREGDFVGRICCPERPVFETQDPVRNGRNRGVVGRKYEGLFRLVAKTLDLLMKRFCSSGVEIARRLVHEHEGRFVHEGPSDGDPLFLSARQSTWLMIGAIREPKKRK